MVPLVSCPAPRHPEFSSTTRKAPCTKQMALAPRRRKVPKRRFSQGLEGHGEAQVSVAMGVPQYVAGWFISWKIWSKWEITRGTLIFLEPPLGWCEPQVVAQLQGPLRERMHWWNITPVNLPRSSCYFCLPKSIKTKYFWTSPSFILDPKNSIFCGGIALLPCSNPTLQGKIPDL